MRLFPLVALIALSTALEAVGKVQSLNIKVGLWEVTTTVAANTEIPIPAELLEKLTPEQRARVEARVKARPSDAPRVTKQKYCLTKEQLLTGATFGQDRQSCTPTGLLSTRSKLEVQVVCVDQEMNSHGTLQVEALDPRRIKGSMKFTTTANGEAITAQSSFTAEWTSPVCSTSK
jgi:hypothetical protein